MSKKALGLCKYLLLFALLIFFDFISKAYVYHNIPIMSWMTPAYPFGGLGVFENFYGINVAICHVQNTGCAWGMFSQYSEVIFFIRIILIFALVIYTFFLNQEKEKSFPLFLIVTGAIGNVIDFFVYGKVIDMFYFYTKAYSFPVFNLADSFISVGIGLLLLQSCMTYFKIKKLKS